jgi:hypothetical protein
MEAGNSRIYQEGVSFTAVRDAPSTIVGLRVANSIQPFSMKTQERPFSIHTARITKSSI